jgi:phage baseplate assembly protein W
MPTVVGNRIGVNRLTGKYLTDFEHVVQSIWDIITTRIGTRVMRLDYGGDVLGLIDQPANRQTIASFYSKMALAINTWEPGFRVARFALAETDNGGGHFVFDIQGIYFPRGHLGDYSVAEDATTRFIMAPTAGELIIVGPAQ